MAQERTKTTQNRTAGDSADNVVVLLCAPVHDRLTEYTSTLLEDFPSLDMPTNLYKFSTPLTYEQLLQKLSIDPDDRDVLVVFCGHGNNAALQGPAAAGDPATARSVFYKSAYIDLGPKYMFAMCCSTAEGLATSFERRTDRAFIGFGSEIGFVMKGGVYAEWWRKVLHDCAAAMLQSKDVHDLRRSVEHIYKAAYMFFQPQGGRRYRYGLMMGAYLRQQLEVIDLVRTR